MIIVILSLMSYDIIYLDAVKDAELKNQIFWIDFIFCMVFLTEFYFRYNFAENKRWFVRNNWIDLITSIPVPDGGALRYGRSLRLMRLLRVARLLRVLRIIFFFFDWNVIQAVKTSYPYKFRLLDVYPCSFNWYSIFLMPRPEFLLK